MSIPTSATAGAVMSPDELERYAEAIVTGCCRLGEGEVLALHGEPAHRELLVALAEAGYRAGARFVDVVYAEPRVKRARIRYAAEETLPDFPAWHEQRMQALLEEEAAIVTIVGEGEPGLLADVDPARAAQERTRTITGLAPYLRAVGEGRARFCLAAWPTPAWAARVYPEAGEEATRRLAQDLLGFARLRPEDREASGWQRHVEVLERRASLLTDLDLRGLEIRAPGTRLDLRLVPGTLFMSAEQRTPGGRLFCANLPTEEVFTSPDAAGTNGTFRCSRPLNIEGRTIEGIEGEFRDGRLVRIEAARREDREFLAAYFARDDGAGRLGEVALVDRSSPIGRT